MKMTNDECRMTNRLPNATPRQPIRKSKIENRKSTRHSPFVIRRFLILLLAAPALAAPLTADSDVNQILDALHERGTDIRSLAADVKLSTVVEDLGDEPETRIGRLVLRRKADNDTQVRVAFDTREKKDKRFKEPMDFVITGQRMIQRDHAAKKETIRVIGKPGDKLDLFKLGQGPFPLPIGQPREDVLKAFDVKKVPLADVVEKPEPAVAAIMLVPKEGSELRRKFQEISVTVRPDGWPVDVKTIDSSSSPNVATARLENIRTNADVTDQEFALPPVPSDYKLVEEALD
jgi:outer membrane lipoprotein-sorting protein